MKKDDIQKRSVMHAFIALIPVLGLLIVSCGSKDSNVAVPNSSGTTYTWSAKEITPCPDTVSAIVSMQSESFNPDTVTIPINGVVRWDNLDTDGNAYWLQFDTIPFSSHTVYGGESVCIRFSAPGSFPYYCDPKVNHGVVNVARTP